MSNDRLRSARHAGWVRLVLLQHVSRLEETMSDNGPRYDWSAAAAAEILNLHFGKDEPKAVLFGKILFVILDAMYKAEEELSGIRY